MCFALPLLSLEKLREAQLFHRNTSASHCEAFSAGNSKNSTSKTECSIQPTGVFFTIETQKHRSVLSAIVNLARRWNITFFFKSE